MVSIEFPCEQCGSRLRIDDRHSASRIRCPHCGRVQRVPDGRAENDVTAPATAPKHPVLDGPGGANPFAEPPRDNPYSPPAADSRLPHGFYGREYAASRVSAPAVALMVTAVVTGALSVLMLVASVANVMDRGADDEDLGVLIMFVVFALSQVLVLVGAVRMKMLRNYGLALTAAILSTLCSLSCTCLTLPIGIWALVVLADSHVRAHFR